MARYAGTNAVVEITDSGGAKTVGVLRSYQLPALQRARVDVTGVADSFAFTLPGRFQQTEFRYTEVWDPLDTTGPTIDALIQDKIGGRQGREPSFDPIGERLMRLYTVHLKSSSAAADTSQPSYSP